MEGMFTPLTVPIKATNLSNDQLVRHLELVRRNIEVIAPFRPESYQIVLYAGDQKSPQPQLMMRLPHKCFVYSELDPERLQSTIDAWYSSHDEETLDQLLDSVVHPTWTSLSLSRFYPNE